MEHKMKKLVIVTTIAALLAVPAAAESLSVLLPSLTYPETVTTPSTKDCLPTAAVACPQE
jgi:hypothetical protein